MNFQKYNKVENTYRDDVIDSARMLVPEHEKWFAQEKIDGANFSFWSMNDGDHVRIAKRSGWTGTDFFNCGKVYDRYYHACRHFHQRLKELHPSLKQVVLYGELFGPGIQNRCFYGNDVDFMIYDIAGYFNGYDPEHMTFFSMDNEAFDIAPNFGFKIVPTIHVGTLEECLSIDVENMCSNVPAILNLSEPENNFAEGIVIKPNVYRLFKTGRRIALKKKNSKFEEKSKKRKKKQRKDPTKGIPKGVLEEYGNLMEYVTENRVLSVVSKVGEITDKDFGKLLGMTIKDAIEDFESDHGIESVRDHFGDHWKVLGKMMQKESQNVVRDVFLKKRKFEG